MKKWSNEEIAELRSVVSRHVIVSDGIRAFMATHPDRSFQACSHVLYRKNKNNIAQEEPAAVALVPTSESLVEMKSGTEKKSFWKKLVSLFIKPKAI